MACQAQDGPYTEIGAVGHADAGRALAHRVADIIGAWAPQRHVKPTYTVYRTKAQTPAPGPGVFVLERGSVQVVLSWGV